MNGSSVNKFLDQLFSSKEFQRGRGENKEQENGNDNNANNTNVVTGLNDAVNNIIELPPVQVNEQKREIVYHIILDTNFPNRNKISEESFRTKITGNIRDRLRNNKSTRLPVLFNIEDARNVAVKLNQWLMDKGTSSGREFPVFGIIILGFRLGDLTVHHIEQRIDQHGGLDYGLLFGNKREQTRKYDDVRVARREDGSKTDLITYMARGFKRGLMNKSAFAKCTLETGSFGHLSNIDLHVGLLFLNNHKNFEGENGEKDINILRQMLASARDDKMRSRPFPLEDKQNKVPQQVVPVNTAPVNSSVATEEDIKELEAVKEQLEAPKENQRDVAADLLASIGINLVNDEAPQEKPVNQLDNENPSVNILKDKDQDGGYKALYQNEKKRYLELQRYARQRGLIA